jgi:hypothetical protein
MQMTHLQKVFCVRGGKTRPEIKSAPAWQWLCNDFAMTLQFCVCQARAIWQRGRLERLLLRA